jgi:hypothetical protein
MSNDFSNLKALTTADKLRIVTELWNDIAASDEPIVVPAPPARPTPLHCSANFVIPIQHLAYDLDK